MTAKRYTVDSITDDALDELYENANRGWRRGDEWKARAEQAEAALERVRAELERDDFTKLTHWVRGWRACANGALAAMDKTEESTTP